MIYRPKSTEDANTVTFTTEETCAICTNEKYARYIRKLGEFMINNADMFVDGVEKDANLEFKVVIDKNGPHITFTKEFGILV